MVLSTSSVTMNGSGARIPAGRDVAWPTGGKRAATGCNFCPGPRLGCGRLTPTRTMTSENLIRALAGSVVLLSLALAALVSPWWLLLTLFAGIDAFRSGGTKPGLCPARVQRPGAGRAGQKGGGSCCR